jgi:hypothetical protein
MTKSNEEPASRFVEVEKILYTLAKMLAQAQRAVDQLNLDLARDLLKLNASAFSLANDPVIPISDQAHGLSNPNVLPLSSLVSFQRYRISELLVEFAVVPEDQGAGTRGAETYLRLVPVGIDTENARLVRFKVVAKERVFGEFQIAGETKATLALDCG